jgi:hypothetical protein
MEDIHYKSGDMMKTVGDAYHAALTTSYNAGADHLLTRGHVSKEEHSAMKDAFDGHIVSFVNDMDGEIRDRKLDAIGSPWLPVKIVSGGVVDRGSMRLSDEADALLGGVAACIKDADDLNRRLTSVKSTREQSGDELGPKAKRHAEDAINALTGLVAKLKSLIESKSEMQALKDRLARSEEFLQKIA